MLSRPLSTVLSIAALALVTACSSAPRRDVNATQAPYPASRQTSPYTEYGRVENIGSVQLASRTNAAGAVLGAVVGAVIGKQFGSGTGKALATGAGAIGGAVAGNAIENRNRRDDEVFRVSVRFDDGSVRDFDFQRVDDLRVGDRVKFEGGQLHRL
ncbi:MAG: glycine zipper 2TM domain-containing protein [Burkholderiaceae bacterium]